MSIRYKKLRRFRRKFQAKYGVFEYRKRVDKSGHYHDIFGNPILWGDLALEKCWKAWNAMLNKQGIKPFITCGNY